MRAGRAAGWAAAALAGACLTAGCGVVEYPEPPEPRRPTAPAGQRHVTDPAEAGGLLKASRGVPKDFLSGIPAQAGDRRLSAYYRLPEVEDGGDGPFSLVLAADTVSGADPKALKDGLYAAVFADQAISGLVGGPDEVDPGPLGGEVACGWTATPEDGDMACTWYDATTAGVITFPSGGSTEDSLALIIRTFTAMRHDIER